MKSVTIYWFLEDFDLMKKMGKRNLMKMCELLEMQPIKKGEALPLRQGEKDVVFFLKSGTVKIVSGKSNRTKYLVKRGNIFGELATLGDQEKEADQAIVLEGGVVCYIQAEQMKELMDQYDSLKNGILKISGLKIKRLERRLESLLYLDAETRIEQYLFDFLDEFGEIRGNTIEARNFLSHGDIGHLTNTSRQTVNNVMSSLRKKGVIDYDSKTLKRSLR